jgi:type I restriction enzyme S subunit
MSREGWKTLLLGDISQFRYGKMPDKRLVTSEDDYPVFSGYKINGYYPKCNCEEAKLIVVARGVGGTGDVKITKEKCWLTNLSIEFLLNDDKASAPFLYYYFLKDTLRHLDSGSAQSQITIDDLKRIYIELPDLSTQCRIANILSALDEKIELTRHINATLEAIAQAIFKEWFIDFNFPGATGEMVESELGMIPKGWRVGKLGDVCNVTMGQSPPGESYNEAGDGIPFYQGRTDFGFRFPAKRVFTIDPKRFAKQFDTLVSVRAPVGDMNIATENCCIGRGLASVSEKNGNHSFTYYFLRELTEKFKSFEDNGTVFGSINKTDFEKMLCIVPNDEAISAFENKCRSIDGLIFNNEQQSGTLTALRDALLPKLMKGEIEV